MPRTLSTLVALALIVGACGGSNEDDFRDQLKEFDPSITDQTVDCLIDELDARGLSVNDVSDDAVNDGPIPEAAQEAMLACLSTVQDSGDTSSDTDANDAADPADPAVATDPDDDLSEPGSPDTYGSDPDLDALWDQCEAGDGAACDDLYFQSDIDSEYEEFGDTCGRRYSQSPGYCEEAMS